MFGAVRVDLADQSRLVVVGVDLFAAIGVGYRYAAFIVPGVMRFHLREVGPVTDAARQFVFVLPLPVEGRAARQLALQNDVLIVVAIALGFAGRVLRFDQTVLCVIAVRHQRLNGIPGIFQVVRWQELLIVHSDNVFAVVTQQQGATGTVIEALDSTVDIARDVQPIAIAVADGDQGGAFAVEAEVVERWTFACLCQNQF